MKVAIMTDSNSGITLDEAKKLGIFVLPMPFTINGKEFLEGINLTQEQFYTYLMSNATVSTSQPPLGQLTDFFDRILEKYDAIVHIPMSSGLSGSCQTAHMVSQMPQYLNKVYVVDSKRISITQKWDVYDALYLSKQGKTAKDIYDILMENSMNASIYITLDTLEYLKKGGRLTPVAAAIGSALKIKPVLTIQGSKLDKFHNVRTMHKAKDMMLNSIIKDIKERIDSHDDMLQARVMVAYTYDENAAKEFKQQVEKAFSNHEIICDPLSLSVSCHIGPGAIAIGTCKKITDCTNMTSYL